MKFADRLKARRKKLGLSADEIADKIGKNQATIHRYESGEIENIPINVVVPLAKVLTTTPDWLMGWDEEPEEEKASTFADRLRIAMNNAGITQSELCSKTNIGKSALSQYLSGKFIPKQSRLHEIAVTLNVSEPWLMGWDRETSDETIGQRSYIGNRIKLRRLQLNLTQEEVGNRLGYNKSTIQRYESGEITEIKLPTLQALAATLNTTPEYLIGLSESSTLMQENPHEAVLIAVESVLNEYLSDTLTASIMEVISKKINKSG